MSKDIPEIDDLTRSINDSELILTFCSVFSRYIKAFCPVGCFFIDIILILWPFVFDS